MATSDLKALLLLCHFSLYSLWNGFWQLPAEGAVDQVSVGERGSSNCQAWLERGGIRSVILPGWRGGGNSRELEPGRNTIDPGYISCLVDRESGL
jgi:uncharacterized protein YbdZ (MbtH family)